MNEPRFLQLTTVQLRYLCLRLSNGRMWNGVPSVVMARGPSVTQESG
jgi:hypothetical protein